MLFQENIAFCLCIGNFVFIQNSSVYFGPKLLYLCLPLVNKPSLTKVIKIAKWKFHRMPQEFPPLFVIDK